MTLDSDEALAILQRPWLYDEADDRCIVEHAPIDDGEGGPFR